PPQTVAEKYERELEQEYLRRDLEEKFICPECQRPIEPDFVLCPHCLTALRRRCGGCQRVVDLTWSVCPYCGDDGSTPTAASRQAPTVAGAVYPALARPGEVSR
ncbi:MAG: zinc ribbon domain-containing protein, partial [Chloroflexales bacterium]